MVNHITANEAMHRLAQSLSFYHGSPKNPIGGSGKARFTEAGNFLYIGFPI